MAVTNVNGSLLKRMVRNGAINLKNNHKEIDQLNVFPVPDGDTGTNMQMTMMAGVREIEKVTSKNISDVTKTLSRGLLMGARGNSGVILSQFFRGVNLGLQDIKSNSASISEFANCLVSGYEVAYKAVTTPVEGTILTVVREAAQNIIDKVSTYKSIDALLKDYLKEALISLENTPNLLPVLKDAGVVDSGGAGFIKVVEGMILTLEGQDLEDEALEDEGSTLDIAAGNFDPADIKFGYCTEFIVELKNQKKFNEDDLKNPLTLLGDSLVVVTDEELVKVHIHTNSPGKVLNLAQKYGEFKKLKIENMREQHSELVNEAQNAQTKPSEKQKYGVIAVCFGDGIKDTFKDLGVDYIIDGGQTMNPPTEEFVKAVKAMNAEHIVIIPNNSNVILSAEQTIALCPEHDIHVLKAKTVSHGYASLMVFDSLLECDENIDAMKEAINNVSTGEVTFAVRDTEINGVKITSGDYMGICNGEIIVSTEQRVNATKELLKASVNEDSAIVTFFYGLNVEEEEVKVLEKYCYELNKDVEVEIINGKQDIYSYIIAVEQ